MAKKSSTSALTPEQHTSQDKRYAEGHEYDYVIVGTGNSALIAGALLAKAGKKICMLEAHDIPGGYIQTFRTGDYYFCAQLHYTWRCGPGGKVYEILKHLGLHEDITFNLYDPEGYDHMAMPDGKTVNIPYGYDKLAENIDAAYPGQKENVKKFTDVLTRINTELRDFQEGNVSFWKILPIVRKFKTIIKYRNKTIQNLFDECNLSKEAQAVLIAGAGDFMEPPEDLAIFPYVGLFGGYNTGAYYPTKHFKYYINRLASFITDHDGCHIYYETPVTEINTEDGKVVNVKTENGKTFTAKDYICNMDPQVAAKMIGWEKFPKQFQKKLTYEYSPSGIVLYLGLKDIDLRDFGFGKHNVWDLAQWDMNKTWKEQGKGDFSTPWFFMSTPTLHSDEPGQTPPGGQILEIATYADFDWFNDSKEESYAKYAKKKMELAERLLDLVEEKYIPNLRKHIVVKTVGTPTTNVDYVNATRGNAYGSRLIPKNMGLGRLNAKTPFENLYWCNASSGYGGMYGTAHTGLALYMDLTGDRFFHANEMPTDAELVESSRKKFYEDNPSKT
ncbi:MAG: NAD(P)/FAD-dependent oxidoreductase [bacterium]|nr:NAD(P)/FAD-dependent oxidoreductase [bacterium]